VDDDRMVDLRDKDALTSDEATPLGPSIPNAFGKIFAGGPHKTFYGLKQPERWYYQWSVDIRFWRAGERTLEGKDDHQGNRKPHT